MSPYIFCYYNYVVILNDTNKFYLGNNIYVLTFTNIRINHYLRRESKQFEYKANFYDIYVDISNISTTDIDEQKKYLSTYWVDYLKNILKSWNKFTNIQYLSDYKGLKVNTPYFNGNELTKSFDDLSKLFTDISMSFNIQPSLLSFYSYSGYSNETSFFIYNYSDYLNNTNGTIKFSSPQLLPLQNPIK